MIAENMTITTESIAETIIAGRLAMSTVSMTPKEIADELVDLLNEMKKESSADEQA